MWEWQRQWGPWVWETVLKKGGGGGVRFLSLTPKPLPPIHLTPTLTTHSSTSHPPHTHLFNSHHCHHPPTQLTPPPLNWPSGPDLTHLTPTHFSLSPYPTPPPSFPKLVSTANLLGFKNWFNWIHFQISLYVYVNNITSCIWWKFADQIMYQLLFW